MKLRILLVALLACAAVIGMTAPDFDKMLQLAATRYGNAGGQAVRDWQAMMQLAANLSEKDKVRRINEFFNRKIQNGDDQALWGSSDYWATPLETMGRGSGDCEDFAISKYFSLRSLNVPNERLRITYVKARIGGPHSDIVQAHMVLGYYEDPAGEPLILDSLITELRPASRRPDLVPVFSFNSDGLWTGTGRAESKDAGVSTARLSRWRDLITRMQAEGFE